MQSCLDVRLEDSLAGVAFSYGCTVSLRQTVGLPEELKHAGDFIYLSSGKKLGNLNGL